MIPKKKVVDFVAKHKTAFEKIQPSFFEMTVGLAFDHFAKEKVDIAVIEVGMGGRLDSTNVITPLLSVITNIGMDHERFLGNTLALIAKEKAGIIKKNIPVVIGETQKETEAVFRDTAEKVKTTIHFADQLFSLNIKDKNLPESEFPEPDILKGNSVYLKKIKSGLTGNYQLKNIITVAAAAEQLRNTGLIIPDKAIRNGMKNVVSATGITGRWQKLSSSPLAYCDSGHNKDGITEVLKQIAKMKFTKLHFVLGVVSDKDIDPVLKMLPENAIYYFCRPQIPRGLSELELINKAASVGLKGHAFPSVQDAYKSAMDSAGKNDLVFVGGSSFVVAEVV